MKMMKKILALSTASAMVFGMAMTTWAVPEDVPDIVSDITVTGLSSDVDTTLNGYKFATLQYDADTNEYSWKIETWAAPYVELNDAGTAYEIVEDHDGIDVEARFKAAAQSQQYTMTATVSGTSHTFENVLIGGYVIIPSDTSAEYEPLFVVNTYDRTLSPNEDGKPVAEDITAAAKSEDHTLVKEQSDKFQQIGDEVEYEIKATFPMSQKSDGTELTEFIITDTPQGLSIDVNTVQVMLGNENVTENVICSVNADIGALTVNFENLVQGGHDGKDIVITYTAVVTDTEYNNTVSANSSTTEYGSDSTEGENGSVEITKVDAENTSTILKGVEFQLYDLGVGGTWNAQEPGTPMSLIYDSELGAYRPALEDETGTTTIIDGTNGDGNADGIIKVVGLDEGNYHFVETKAPNGYSINDQGLTVTIDPDAETPVIDIEANFLDTKLSSLPSTGGIGTTIFTIGGCVIMVTAAGLYFATRKKEQK